MTAHVIPFPRARHHPFIRKQALRMASLPHAAAAERHLSNQLGILAANLAKQGVPGDRISAELRAVDCAIRAELWRAVITPGGAA